MNQNKRLISGADKKAQKITASTYIVNVHGKLDALVDKRATPGSFQGRFEHIVILDVIIQICICPVFQSPYKQADFVVFERLAQNCLQFKTHFVLLIQLSTKIKLLST
jgi:hypothetical protein